MKLIITGATGFVGKRLVPFLADKGHELLLIGRDKNALEKMFPGLKCADYASVTLSALEGYDCCLHLAARNNQHAGTRQDFLRDNVDFLKEFCALLLQANVNRHIYISSILALEESPSPYADSKWQAEEMLKKLAEENENCHVQILRPAYIHTLPYRGKLEFLNKLPSSIAGFLFQGFAALKTSVSFEEFAASIEKALNQRSFGATNPEILTNRQTGNAFYALCRWLIDRAFALAVLLVFGLFFPVLVLLIRQNSKGPALFAQTRIGKHGKPFPCYKFRTMHIGTKQAATHEVSQSSVTSIGRFLRKYKIDELPQVWNILRGEISLIGPRPCLPIQDELINCRQNLGVLDHLPGITGYAQINNIDMSNPARLAKVDADYILRRTLIMDIKIVFKTFLGKGLKDKTSTS